MSDNKYKKRSKVKPVAPSEKGFLFDDENHIYWLDGQMLQGVTSILNIIGGNKTAALMAWSVKLCAEYLIKNRDALLETKTKAEFEEIIKEAKGQHRKKKEGAGDEGTKIHKQCEEYFKDGTIPTDPRSKAVIDWIIDNEIDVVHSEIRLFHRELYYAGTVDIIGRDKNGNWWVMDIKSSSGVRDRGYFAQMAAYQMAWEWMVENEPEYKHLALPEGKRILGHCIIHIDKKTGVITPHLSTEVGKNKATFEAALRLYRNIDL